MLALTNAVSKQGCLMGPASEKKAILVRWLTENLCIFFVMVVE